MHLTDIALTLLLQQAVAAQLHPHPDQAVLNSKDDMDFVDSGYYYGISTFAHTRYVNCYSDADSKDNLYDIAIIGAPHDTVSRPRSQGNQPMSRPSTDQLSPLRRRPAAPAPDSAPTASGKEASARGPDGASTPAGPPFPLAVSRDFS